MNQDGSPAQAPEMNSDEKAKLSQEDLQMKYGVLASYHIPNVSQEDLEKNINSVNVFRIILNNYFGYNLPYLPDCHYSLGGKGKIYHYTEISKRMFGVESTECK